MIPIFSMVCKIRPIKCPVNTMFDRWEKEYVELDVQSTKLSESDPTDTFKIRAFTDCVWGIDKHALTPGLEIFVAGTMSGYKKQQYTVGYKKYNKTIGIQLAAKIIRLPKPTDKVIIPWDTM